MSKWYKVKARMMASLTPSHALYDAIDMSNTDILNALLSYPDQRRRINTPWGELTPVHLSVAYKNDKALAILLANGAKPSPRLDYFPYSTPLHSAVRNKDDTAIRLLILYGADTNKLADSHGITPKMSAQGNQHLVKVIEQASEWRMLISQYEVKIKQAENQHDTKIAVEYYTKLAEVWQQVAQQETNLDTKNFYEQKALDYYKKAQPTSISSIALAKSSSQPVPPMSFGYYCMQFFKSVPQSEERRPLLEQAIVTYTHSPS